MLRKAITMPLAYAVLPNHKRITRIILSRITIKSRQTTAIVFSKVTGELINV